MEPTDALRSTEVALRLAVRTVLGDQWISAPGAPSEAHLISRRTEEDKRRDGAVVSPDLLDYTQTYDLVSLVKKNWEQFKPVFGDKNRTLSYLQAILDVRNSIAHSRELVPFERDLVSGISGQLRNQVALFRGTVDESSRFYPRIESVIDSFGREALPLYASVPAPNPVRLEVGDVLDFRGRAFTASEQTIEWLLVFHDTYGLSAAHQPYTVAAGNDVSFQYTVIESDVGEDAHATILISSTSRFHRYSKWPPVHDDRVSLNYRVNPPRN